ncbi:MAG: nucleotidyltransferase family protein [Spirochaetaceae bacterium]|nr:nucleotidyltransferase family protein [Spirochaetaceae bacterium]
MSSVDRIYAILMASGFSRRFGEADKLLAVFRGKPLARHTVDLVCGLDCFTRIFFVAAKDPVRALAGGGPERLRVIRNRHPERGRRESIRLGLEAASEDGRGPGEAYYMFFPCDQPLLDAAAVSAIVEARRPGRIVRPCCRGEPGNPVLFSAAFRDELLALGEGEQGRDLIRRHPERLINVEIPGPAFSEAPSLSPLTDIDDPRTLSLLEGTASGRP